MADKLQKLRLSLVNGSNKGFVKSLMDDLQDARILSDAEWEHINEEYSQARDKMRALVDMVKKKGDRSSEFLIQKVSERNPALSDSLGITVVHPLPTQEQGDRSPNQIVVLSSQQPRAPSPSQLVVHPLPTQEQGDRSSSQQDVRQMSIQERNGSSPSKSVNHLMNTQSDSHSQPACSIYQVPPREKNQAIKQATAGIMKCSDENYKRINLQEKIYPIREKNDRTRLALIICNIYFEFFPVRQGAQCDVLGMKYLLSQLGYKVKVATDLSLKEMQDTMQTFSKEKDHYTSDSTFIVIMSHGLRDRICGTDSCILENGKPDKLLHVDEIFNTFNNVNCPALENKPKVIIIQACRGDMDSRVEVKDGSCALSSDDKKHLEHDGCRVVQRERDFACFFSTTPDTKSLRNVKKGSLFIQDLIEHITAGAHLYSLQDIFQNVQLSFKNREQMPTLERTTLVKKFYLFPGH